jgi:hypothetical protein
MEKEINNIKKKKKIRAVVAIKITVNQSTQVPDNLKFLTPNMGHLLKQHSQNMGKIISFILGSGCGSDKTSTTHRISLNALKVNRYINEFFARLIRCKTANVKIVTPKSHDKSVITMSATDNPQQQKKSKIGL